MMFQRQLVPDRIVFLDDGRIVSEMHDPTQESVLDRLKELGSG